MKYLLIPIIYILAWCQLTSQKDTSAFDPLLLDEVVITDFSSDKKLVSALSLSSIKRPADRQLQGVASTLSQVSGIFADASTGEVFSRVYARGVSLSAEDDIGWYYMSLQEDGLPITAVQYNQFSPDFFFRPDVSHGRMEVLKGGKSNILAPGAPGGIINFITEKTPRSYETHDRLTVGFYDGGRPYLRVEGFSGSQIGSSSWAYDFSYLYRHDQGPRNLDYALNNGGQIKLGLKKNLRNGIISLKLKWLDDKVNRYTGVAATGWTDPTPAFGQSFRTTSLLPPSLDGTLPDPRTFDGTSFESLSYDPASGIRTKDLSGTLGLDLALGEWRLTDQLKYSAKSINWQTAIGGQPLGLDNFITYFVSGDQFPLGNVTFSDARSGQALASVDNAGAFAPFQGFSGFFEYNNGALPNDAVMGTGTWYKDDEINEWMNQLLLQRSFTDVDLTLGSFYSRSAVDIFTNASFLYSTYEPQPRLLSVMLEAPDGSVRPLSDANGLSNPGGLFYEAADITAGQLAFFGDADLQLTTDWSLEAGLRYELISHSGTKDRSAPAPNSGTLIKAGDDPIDQTYSYLNYSIALEHSLTSSIAGFARYSLGHKAPELNYYINNFSNQEIPSEAPPVQKIKQIEFGLKSSYEYSSAAITAFVSNLSDVAYSNFVFDDQANQIFYTPTQFNSTRTIGLELEFGAALTEDLSYDLSVTYQRPKLNSFTLYNANGSIDTGDDRLVDFSDNILPHNPEIMGTAGITYEKSDWLATLRLNHIGARYGNLENAFELPAYDTVGLDLGYALSSSFAIGLRVKNIFNSAGLANFFGPNSFGSNSDAATAEYIAANPNGSFVVFPIMPRAIYLSVDYSFGG